MYRTIEKEKGLLVFVYSVQDKEYTWPLEYRIEEFKRLVNSTGIEISHLELVKSRQINPALYIGKGKAYKLAELVNELDVNVVIFNNDLTFTQQRNLEDILGIKTIDRTQLVLDIFARHAHTQEGALQVELAQLEYLLPRLKGKGIALSRLGGGIGTRGPGEKKLEVEKRRITDRISWLKNRLEEVKKQRALMRHKREKEDIPLFSLVGYTNAGKSTLLNSLTNSQETTADSMFTTLDPVSRILNVCRGQKVIITDTVGFIHHLPPTLLEAFKATLEELHYADLLIHVVDASSTNYNLLINAVEEILKQINCQEKETLLVFNKIDCLQAQRINEIKFNYPSALLVSALKKINIDVLINYFKDWLDRHTSRCEVFVPFEKMKILDFLYRKADVKKVEYKDNGVSVIASLPDYICGELKKEGLKYQKIK